MLVDGFVVRSILEAADGDSLDRLPEDRFEQLAKHVGLLMVKNPVHRKPRENAPTFSFDLDKADSDRGGGELSDDEEDQENKAPPAGTAANNASANKPPSSNPVRNEYLNFLKKISNDLPGTYEHRDNPKTFTLRDATYKSVLAIVATAVQTFLFHELKSVSYGDQVIVFPTQLGNVICFIRT